MHALIKTTPLIMVMLIIVSGCTIDPPTKTAWIQYQEHMEQGNYEQAKISIEKSISEAPSADTRNAFILLNAYNYYFGQYGNIDLERFEHWAGRGACLKDTTCKYLYNDLQKAKGFVDSTFQQANQLYVQSLTFCETERLTVLQDTLEASSNAPLLVINAKKCLDDHLSTSTEARTLYRQLTLATDTRDNASTKAQGIEIYDREDVDYRHLPAEDKQALLSFLHQLIYFDTPPVKRTQTPLTPNSVLAPMNTIILLIESTHDDDWLTIMEKRDEVLATKGVSTEYQHFMLTLVMNSAFMVQKENAYQSTLDKYLASGSVDDFHRWRYNMLYSTLLYDLGLYDQSLEHVYTTFPQYLPAKT